MKTTQRGVMINTLCLRLPLRLHLHCCFCSVCQWWFWNAHVPWFWPLRPGEKSSKDASTEIIFALKNYLDMAAIILSSRGWCQHQGWQKRDVKRTRDLVLLSYWAHPSWAHPVFGSSSERNNKFSCYLGQLKLVFLQLAAEIVLTDVARVDYSFSKLLQ